MFLKGNDTMARMVVCQYCREKFERIDGEFEKDTKGFYHKACHTKMVTERASRQGLMDYAYLALGETANMALVAKQIKDFVEKKHMTESGIKGTLYYLVEIKKQRLDPKFGIALVPYHYQTAKNYFLRLEGISDMPKFEEIEYKQIIISEPVNRKRGRTTNLEDLFQEGEI